MLGKVTVENSKVSKAIRAFTNSPVSHSIIYIGTGDYVVEAIGDGVVRRSLNSSISDASLAVAYRHPEVNESNAKDIRRFLAWQLGKPYNYAGIARQADKHCIIIGIVDRTAHRHNSFFCSELVWAAYASVGIKLSDTAPSWTTPNDIPTLKSVGALDYVGHLKA
jgi:uncharacterized protein YycO